LADAALRTFQEVVDQLAARVPHLHVKRFNLVGEVVEHPDCGNSHKQTDSGGHQRFRNTACDGAQTGGLLVRNTLERVDDADDRSEQTHEGGGGTDGRQRADAAFQFGVNDSFGALESSLGCLDLFARNLRADLVRLEFLETSHDDLGQVALLEAVGNLDGFVQFSFAQSAGNCRCELARLFTGRAVSHQAVNHDTDGVGRHDEQADNDGFRQGPHLPPKGGGIPTNGAAAFLKQIQRPYLQLQKHRFSLSCELICTFLPARRERAGTTLLAQREVHVDLSRYLDRLAVQLSRLVHPLFHRFESGRNQQRMAADYLEILNRAVLRNHRRQVNHTRNARLLGERRID